MKDEGMKEGKDLKGLSSPLSLSLHPLLAPRALQPLTPLFLQYLVKQIWKGTELRVAARKRPAKGEGNERDKWKRRKMSPDLSTKRSVLFVNLIDCCPISFRVDHVRKRQTPGDREVMRLSETWTLILLLPKSTDAHPMLITPHDQFAIIIVVIRFKAWEDRREPRTVETSFLLDFVIVLFCSWWCFLSGSFLCLFSPLPLLLPPPPR